MIYFRGSLVNIFGVKDVISNFVENSLNITIQSNVSNVDMQFTTKGGYWYLQGVFYNGNNYTAREITAPASFSYHCSDLQLQTSEGVKLVFPEIQVNISTFPYIETNSNFILYFFYIVSTSYK